MFRFTRDIIVEGKQYREGDTVASKEIPEGSLCSCLWIGALVPIEAKTQSITEPRASKEKGK